MLFADCRGGGFSDQKTLFTVFTLAIIEEWRDVWSATIKVIQIQKWCPEIGHECDVGLSLLEWCRVQGEVVGNELTEIGVARHRWRMFLVRTRIRVVLHVLAQLDERPLDR